MAQDSRGSPVPELPESCHSHLLALLLLWRRSSGAECTAGTSLRSHRVKLATTTRVTDAVEQLRKSSGLILSSPHVLQHDALL
ncbi:hypothetical protein EXIGLDRAFT_729146 [Exidia glandulosa HHB12029]|uniref:Uncharacterized protein n=1 Tax=Exidia glandulosa HHB12029 TaxID=1314781 RepID=A0A165CQ88_EXIGL|nr:hypothetical protein EXIGLDRAFT_729146 [Exidia glandulosa HHB12029]